MSRVSTARIFRSPLAVFVAAFAVRMAVMAYMQSFHVPVGLDHFRFGFETGRIARSLASGEGFSSPFVTPTGPTAWLPPVYPYLLAGIFKVFGIYSSASALCALILNSLFSALTCITIFIVGIRTVGNQAAGWAAWGWAFSPYAVFWSVGWIWPVSLSAFLFTALILSALELERRDSTGGWAVFGLLWGIAALTDTALLVMLPFFLVWLIRGWAGEKLFGRGIAAFALTFALVLSPWIVRNYRAFGEWGIIRSNFGVELRVANYEGSTGLSGGRLLHPADNDIEQEQLRRMGELDYAEARKKEALQFIASQPLTFLWLTLKRVFYFWTGTPQLLQIFRLSGEFVMARYVLFSSISAFAFWGLVLVLRNRVPAASLFAISMIVLPLLYYVTHPTPRYRHSIEPVMFLLAAYALRGGWHSSSVAITRALGRILRT